MSSGSQRRRGRHVGIYLNSEQYTRLQMAASEHEATPGTFAKEKVLDALAAVQAYKEAATWSEELAAAQGKAHSARLARQARVQAIEDIEEAFTAEPPPPMSAELEGLVRQVKGLIDEALPVRPSDSEPPAEGFRCTFEDSGYRCALETGHGGIHISAQGYRLAVKRA